MVIEIYHWGFTTRKVTVTSESVSSYYDHWHNNDAATSGLLEFYNQETQVQSLDWEDALEKDMATHSTILAGKIPWTKLVAKRWTWLKRPSTHTVPHLTWDVPSAGDWETQARLFHFKKASVAYPSSLDHRDRQQVTLSPMSPAWETPPLKPGAAAALTCQPLLEPLCTITPS